METFHITGTSDDNPKGHDGKRDDTNTPAQMDDTNNAGKHTTDIEDGGAFPVPVGRNIIGLVDNKMYANDSTQQADKTEQPAIRTEHEETEAVPDDCDDDSDSHTYNYIDDDQEDINNVRQVSQDIQAADEEGDTTQPSSDQQSSSDTTNNANYVPAALRKDNSNALGITGGVISTYLTAPSVKNGDIHPPLANTLLITDSPVGITRDDLTPYAANMSTASLVVTTALPNVTTPLQERTTISESVSPTTIVMLPMKHVEVTRQDKSTTMKGANVALGKMAYQTSTYMTYAAVPSRAVDGITSTHMRTGSCTHTEEEDNPTWWVNLGQPYKIDRVVIFNRLDCCVERINAFNIHIGDSKQVIRNPKCGGHHWIEVNKPSVSIPCQGMRGQYVGVRLPGSKRILSLCEVQVFSEPAFTCEGGTLRLSCPAGETLVISDANYGRTSTSHACPCTSCNTNCRAADSLSIVKRSCQGLQKCAVTANDNVFIDPCPGTEKYLETTYRCVSGCRSGYKMHNKICYKAFNKAINFLDASWTCRTEGGTLAMPKDASTNNFLISLKNAVDDRGYFWLGLVDRRVEGVWKWVDGTRLGHYSAWGPGEPNNLNNEDSAKSDSCRVGYKLLATFCVRLNFRAMSHQKATEACEREGARLAMPKTEELDIALRNLVRREGQNMGYWIGLKDKESFYLRRRQWGWVDGSTLGNYKGWNPGEPSNKRTYWHLTKLCVQYWSGRPGYPMWDDVDCSESRRFICQAHLT
ncbi:hypothetical protein Bbelb_200120 [Branchiostoma belcheri]|nr:hypothetical protein Bbelb_200120 [Branchiostoma belcheri]